MVEHEFLFSIRNVLLAHLALFAAASPRSNRQLYAKFGRIWKTLRRRLVSLRSKPGRSSFWEIDMTKFEP